MQRAIQELLLGLFAAAATMELNINISFLRGQILFLHRRFDLAEREFRKALLVEPTHSIARAMLALCLCELKKYREAIETTASAIAAAPDEAFCHYALAHILFRCNRLNQARAAIKEAIRLNPDKAASYGQYALIEFNAGQWSAALKMAEQGLQINPEDINSNIARVRALERLGRKSESKQAALNLLRIGPEDEYAHVNTGWSYLDCGDHVQALEHFREALRITPNLEPARLGLLEAIRCRLYIYRLARSFGVWFGAQRYKPLTLVTSLLWTLIITPILLLLIIIGFFQPLFAALVRFDRYGRLALSRDQIWESNLTCGATLLAIACIVGFFFVDRPQLLLAALQLFGVSMLTKLAFRSRLGSPRVFTLLAVATYLFYCVATQIWLNSLHGIREPGSMHENDELDRCFFIFLGTYALFFICGFICKRISSLIPNK